MSELTVLDHGYVRLVTYTPWNMTDLATAVRAGDLEAAQQLLDDHDLAAVNAARASFAAEKTALDEKDLGLLRFLAEAKPVPHSSPFRHNHVTLEVYAPLFVGRQWWRHVVGAATLEEGTPWSELSRRYVRGKVDYYLPREGQWRAAPANAKQGSGGTVDGMVSAWATASVRTMCDAAINAYEALIDEGVAPEQARMVLPQNIYTSFRWSPSVQALANFLVQRLDEHAQTEIRIYAEAVLQLTQPIFPHALKALVVA
jgi:thymidylate synthase (FAD)